MKYNIEVLLENNDSFEDFLKTKLRAYNDNHSIHHKKAREKGSVQPINMMVLNDEKEWIGGITADVYWEWLEIKDFWFSEEFRGKGFGGALLEQTEKIAIEKGAKKALLTTFEFQARTFYEKKGFKVVGEIKGYPPGSSYYTMVKILI